MDMGRRLKNCDLIFSLGIIIIFVALVFRCFYGIGLTFSDEFSQPAVVKRFLQGDRVLIDDWQPATTLLGFFMSGVLCFLPISGISLIGMRLAYVLFQVIITFVILLALGWRDTKNRIIALAYLISTPYGIMSICYNTVAIAGFVVFLALFLVTNSNDHPLRSILAGVALSYSVVSIPHVAIIFIIYVIAVFLMLITHKANKLFSMRRLIWLCVGILLMLLPFCISLVLNGSIQEYTVNIHYIFSDPEHSIGIWTKLVASVYQVARVYWRAWLPLVLIDFVAIIIMARRNNRTVLYIASCLAIVYATIRFAFIYGSISINLMIVPMFFWGLQAIVLLLIWKESLNDYYIEIIWLVAGYLFATCDYLATNTEVLSMSAMFIVSAMASISLNLRIIHKLFLNEKFPIIASYGTIIVFLISLFILRMTFIWGDDKVSSLNTRIESGFARGIYTTAENAADYNRIQEAIENAEFTEKDLALFIPMNPLYNLMSDAEISTPYVIRFKADIDEISSYYNTHEYKIPTKVVLFKNKEEKEVEEDVMTYFTSANYKCKISDEDYVVLEAGGR